MCKAPSLLLETRHDGWILGSHLEQEGAMHWGWHGTSQKPRTLVAVELMAPWAPSQALAWEGNSLPRVHWLGDSVSSQPAGSRHHLSALEGETAVIPTIR